MVPSRARILVINPGSTSTKLAYYEGDEERFCETQRYEAQEIAAYGGVAAQEDFRLGEVRRFLEAKGLEARDLDAVVARGGLLKPIPGGTYRVNGAILAELREARRGSHASNLGAPLAARIAEDAGGVPSFIVDPVVVDELMPQARPSGMPEIERISILHALNQKAVARRAAKEIGKDYGEALLVVAHLGGGISVGAHRRGAIVDVNNALDGDGPFSPERAGSLPAGELVKLCFSGRYTHDELRRKMVGGGGLVAHLGTNDLREAERRIGAGDSHAELVVDAMAYQVAREIGARAVALNGEVDAVVLTGGLVHSESFCRRITGRISWIAQVLLYPGEDEMRALAEGALRVLRGEERARDYT